MITCTNCNAQLEDGTKFCENCGSEVVETIFCPHCGQQTSSEFAFCQQCGASLTEETVSAEETASTPETVSAQEGEQKKFKLPFELPFKLSKKLVTMAGAGVALLLVVILLLSLIIGGGEPNYGLYVKDGEIYYSNFSRKDPLEVTSNLYDGDFENSDYAYLARQIGYNGFVQMDEDGKVLFYIDKMDMSSNGANLYYRRVDKPKRDPEKIDSDVTEFKITPSGKTVTYLKDGTLYQHNLKDKDKVASDVVGFRVTEDGKKVVYQNDEGTLYYKYAKKDKVKIDSEVSDVEYMSEDLKTIYYIKDGSLYKAVEGKDKDKIASDVDSVVAVFESGELYYTKSDESEINLMDYIVDDMKEADAAMKEPEYPERPYSFEYDTYEEYDAAYDAYTKAYDEYREALDEYYDKEERDELREDLKDYEMENSSSTLYYFNGKKETAITDAYKDFQAVASDKAVVVYSAYNQSAVKKVKISEIDYLYEVEEMVEEALYSSIEYYAVIEDKATAIGETSATGFDIKPDGSCIYYLQDVSEENSHGDLYSVKVSGNKLKKAERYDTDVYDYAYFEGEDQYVYFKDVDAEDEKGDMYINKKKIDEDVYMYSHSYIEDSETMVYYTDYSDEKDSGTLKTCKKGKVTEVKEDVSQYVITAKGEILYLYDYSTKNYKGDLYLFKNKKSKQIDEDVVSLIPIY